VARSLVRFFAFRWPFRCGGNCYVDAVEVEELEKEFGKRCRRSACDISTNARTALRRNHTSNKEKGLSSPPLERKHADDISRAIDGSTWPTAAGRRTSLDTHPPNQGAHAGRLLVGRRLPMRHRTAIQPIPQRHRPARPRRCPRVYPGRARDVGSATADLESKAWAATHARSPHGPTSLSTGIDEWPQDALDALGVALYARARTTAGVPSTSSSSQPTPQNPPPSAGSSTPANEPSSQAKPKA
jgi:hypothetical protein